MPTSYTARAYRNRGRKGFLIAFRHPLKSERGRPGRKVCKGLGTEDEAQAKELERELNALLSRADLHSLAGRDMAARTFDPRVVALFYEDLDPTTVTHRALRERLMPLPTRYDGYDRSLLIGITGAGKSTLLRRLAGTDGERDRFPSTSVNRTTTCDIEIITDRDQYSAVVTFLSRHQAQQEVIESLSAAVLKAIEGATDAAVAAEFLEQSDQRFRLKYVLGDVAEPPAAEPDAFTFDMSAEDAPRTAGAATSEFIGEAVAKLREIAAEARAEVAEVLGPLDHLQGDARDFALAQIIH